MKIDLHIHSKFSHDSNAKPEKIVNAAKRKGLDGIVITEHCYGCESWEEFMDPNFVILNGVEASIGFLGGEFHLLIYGIESDKQPPYSLDKAVEMAKKNNWALVAPHPFNSYRGILRMLEIEGFSPDEEIIKEGIHALEVNGRYGGNRNTIDFAEKVGMPLVGGSDAHSAFKVGCVYTELDRDVHTMQELVRELKAGRFKYGMSRWKKIFSFY